MKKQFSVDVEIPEGVECEFDKENESLKCKKGEVNLEKKFSVQGTNVDIENNKVRFVCQRANKKSIAMIRSCVSHVKNLFKGLEEKFVYEMEVCHVHFPMTVKVESDVIVIGNFLGEKINRSAKILPGVDVDVKGQQMTVSSHSVENAGQTAANIEKATRVSKKDRRIFQDGIFITSKPGRAI